MAVCEPSKLFKGLFRFHVPARSYLKSYFFGDAHHVTGKHPKDHNTIKQYLKKKNEKDPKIYFKVDIGLPAPLKSRKKEVSMQRTHLRTVKANREMEIAAMHNKLEVSLDDVDEEWANTIQPNHTRKAAEFYGVFDHLFGDAYFTPYTKLNVLYSIGEDQYLPVKRGNVIRPKYTVSEPTVEFEGDLDALYTLILTNPDGHLTQNESEYIHWFIGNIRNGDITSGETIKSYMRTFPPRGTGYHRMVFVLFKQDKGPIDYADLKAASVENGKTKKEGAAIDLESERTFNTYDFYRQRQDQLTPVGLAFFQTLWDTSVKEFFHHTLDLPEPYFEYNFPEPPKAKQQWFPKREPFNTYLDRYRDPKEISREVLLKKLKKFHPFEGLPHRWQFPGVVSPWMGPAASWLKVERKKELFGWGIQYNENQDIIDPK